MLAPMVIPEIEELEQQVIAGAWVSSGAAARLLGADRWQVDDWLRNGSIRHRKTKGGHRRCHPEDVLRMLAARRQVYRGDTPADS